MLIIHVYYLLAGRALLQCCKLVNKERAAAAASGKGSNSSVAAAAGYEAVAERAFGPAGLAIVSGIMYAELLGICCVYVVLEVSTAKTLQPRVMLCFIRQCHFFSAE